MKIRQEELEALRLLKKHFPQYKNLIHSDKPDLIDYSKSIGVEITRAVDSEMEKQKSYFYVHLKGKTKAEVRQHSIVEVEKSGFDIVCIKDGERENAERMYGLVRVFDLEEKRLLHKAICAKYAKKYQELDSIVLYIFFRHMCREAFGSQDWRELLHVAHNCENEYGRAFEQIMIDFYSELIVIDLKTESVKEITNYGD